MMPYHIPVLLNECVEALNINPNGVYVDLTFGGGGHSRAIVEQLNAQGHLYAFDRDEDAQHNAIDDARFTLIRGNFRYFRNFLEYHGVEQVDGILADLGLSSHHLDTPERGFAFSHSGPLDMRMNRSARISAREIVTNYSEEQLATLFISYGELSEGRMLARRICAARAQSELCTVNDLVEVLSPAIPQQKRNKVLAQAFQAIRIEVNHELDALRAMLHGAAVMLRPGGRLAVISYHSLEDRLVKHFMRSGNFDDDDRRNAITGERSQVLIEPLSRQVIIPTPAEQQANSRSRSAKLRVGVRI